MTDDVTAIRIMIRLISRSESRSTAVRILRGKHADAKEMDQEPDGCDVIRLVIRLYTYRDPAREREKKYEKKNADGKKKGDGSEAG